MEMIKRAAQAIDPAAFMPAARGDGFVVRRMEAMEKARAVIASMREPTEAMSFAGFSHNKWSNRTGIRVGRVTIPADGAWRAMIDAALQEDHPNDER